MNSEYGADIDAILIKDGNQWTTDDILKIDILIRDGQRKRLKEVRAQLQSENPAP